MSITVCHNGLYCHQMLMWLSTFASLWCLKVATNQLCLLQFLASNALQVEGKHQNSWESAISTPIFLASYWYPTQYFFKANSNLRKYLVPFIFQGKPCKQKPLNNPEEVWQKDFHKPKCVRIEEKLESKLRHSWTEAPSQPESDHNSCTRKLGTKKRQSHCTS